MRLNILYFLNVFSLEMFLFCFYLRLNISPVNGESFNTSLEECKVIYLDRKSDYIAKDDIDGVHVKFSKKYKSFLF